MLDKINDTFSEDVWKPNIYGVMTVVKDDDHVLLVQKLKEPGKGLVGLPAGKREKETPEIGAVRETIEETSVHPLDIKHIGKIKIFHYQGIVSAFGDELEDLSIEVDLFYATKWRSNHYKETWPHMFFPSNECGAFWVKVNEIPYNLMWKDAKYWFDDALEGRNINSKFYYVEGELDCYAHSTEK